MDAITQDLENLEKLFHASKDVLLTTRMNPRIDGICAMLAFAHAFSLMPLTSLSGPNQSRKIVTAVAGRQGSQLASLPGAAQIVSELGLRDFVIAMPGYVNESVDSVSWYVDQGRLNVVIKSNPAVPMQFDPKQFDPFYAGANFDVVCVIDVDALADIGNLYRQDPGMFTELPTVNISTSLSNARFGRVNVVDAQVSSVSELMYELLSALNVHINNDIASILLYGIADATENMTQKVGARTQEIIQELQRLSPTSVDLYTLRSHFAMAPLPIHPQGQMPITSPQGNGVVYPTQMPPMYPLPYQAGMPPMPGQSPMPQGQMPLGQGQMPLGQGQMPLGQGQMPPQPYYGGYAGGYYAPTNPYMPGQPTYPQSPMGNFPSYHAPMPNPPNSAPGYSNNANDPGQPWQNSASGPTLGGGSEGNSRS